MPDAGNFRNLRASSPLSPVVFVCSGVPVFASILPIPIACKNTRRHNLDAFILGIGRKRSRNPVSAGDDPSLGPNVLCGCDKLAAHRARHSPGSTPKKCILSGMRGSAVVRGNFRPTGDILCFMMVAALCA